MALSFPTGLDDFFRKLDVESATPDLGEAVELNQDGWGSLIMVDLGERLWRMEVTLMSNYYGPAQGQNAKLNVFRQAGRSMLVHALPNPYPYEDPDGSRLGSASPKLYAVGTNRRDIQLSGVPSGYILTAGDFLSFQYGSNPTRYAFHQVVSDRVVTASNGRTPSFEVVPAIRTGFILTADVQLIRPYFKGIVIPGVSMGKSSRQFTGGTTFTVQQTLRE